MLPTEMAAVTPVQSETTQAEWEEVQSIISQYYGEWNEPDTEGVLNTRIPNTALLGNGDVGLASAGNDSIKQFLISKSDFWEYNGNPTYSKYGSPLLIGTYSIAEAGSQSTVNLARTYSKVTASSYYNEPDNGIYFPPEYAVDGQLGDSSNAGYRAWVSGVCKDINWADYKAQGNKYIATGNAPEWLQLEFDEPISFNRWVLTNDSYTRGVSSFDTRDCQIMISDDGESWTTVSELKGNTRPIVEVKMDKTATAKFVRLNITNPGYDPRARVAEFELYCDKIDEVKNLAPTYKNVTASSSNGSSTPDLAVNGEWKTGEKVEHWVSGEYGEGKTHWLKLEFDKAITFNHLKVVNDSAARNTGEKINTKDFQIQVSDDDANWTTIYSVTGNNDDICDIKLDEACTAKFVRLYITKAMEGKDPRARIIQFEIYNDVEDSGEDDADTTTDTYFYEKEDILNAEVYTEMKIGGQIVNMKTYMAATDNIMVTELSGVEKAVDLQLNLAPNSGGSDIRPITVAANDDGSITITRQTALNEENMPADDLVQSVPYSSKAAVTSKIIGTDSAANIVGDSAELVFTLEPGKT
ncbi:MAG: discoidin domain-containing protein, partial [Candidatus Flemingiibacterium sp.]